MLQKLKVTSCAFIFCLFGLTLMTVTPVLAMDSEFARCDKIGSGNQQSLKKRLRCFKPLALDSGGRKVEKYHRCENMEKGPDEGRSWPSRKLECFRALATSMGRHPNPDRQLQYEMDYKHNCVFNQRNIQENMFANQQPFLDVKARCDAAKKAACQGKKGKKKAKCKKTWEAGLGVFLDGYESARPIGKWQVICRDQGGSVQKDGRDVKDGTVGSSCCTRPLRNGGGCTPGSNENDICNEIEDNAACRQLRRDQ
jgi:hypothetical protein